MSRILTIAAMLLIVGCDSSLNREIDSRNPVIATNIPQPSTRLDRAIARLSPRTGHAASGKITLQSIILSSAANAVEITGAIHQLNPDSEFGFHIHKQEDCAAVAGATVSTHFNPRRSPHGGPYVAARHLGDLKSLWSNDEGTAIVSMVAKGIVLRPGALRNVVGRAIVIDEGRDDLTAQSSGDSGDVIACGIITADNAG